MKQFRKYIWFVGFSFLVSCDATKYLAPGEKYYNSASINLQAWDSSKVKNADLSETLQALLRPQPASTVLGAPIGVYIYNLAGDPSKKGWLRNWLRKKGTPPPTISNGAITKNMSILKNRLDNKGYFYNDVKVDSTVKDRKLDLVYTATIDTQYMVRQQQIIAPDTTSQLGKILTDMNKSSEDKKIAKYIKKHKPIPAKPYDLDYILAYREKIDNRLKNKGFYYFNSDYILDLVDSTVGNHQVDMKFKVKRNTPPIAKKQFRINNIYVFSQYEIGSDTSLTNLIPIPDHNGAYVKSQERILKPKVFSRLLGFQKGDLYNRNDHNLALNRLQSLGMYRFVKARFEEVDTAGGKNGWLNTYYYLTPTAKKSLRFEVSGYTKSNNSNGTELAINWTNRNFFRGAEQFTARIYGGLEKQVLKNVPNISTQRFGAEISLAVPRIIAPFYVPTNKAYVPQTNIRASYDFYSRSTQYTLNSMNLTWGYTFQETIAKQHKLNLFSFTYVRPTHITTDFQAALDTNVVLRRSIEKQFIIGPNYNYNFSTLNYANSSKLKNNFYVNLNLDLSGNIMGLTSGTNINKGKGKYLFGIPYSQYVRGEADLRHYFKLDKNNSIASRLLMGLGYAYGNSSSMPFVKSFFVGGPNDLRAFSTRSLGPGSYYAGNPRFASTFLGEQPGDMKLEFNTELRAKLFSIVQGAIFVDAGNTWLLRSDTSRPGGAWSKNFYKQIAVGTGAGLRFDVSILVLRLDLGVPLRSPDTTNGFDWNFNKMSWNWIQRNWVWNIAIGFPF